MRLEQMRHLQRIVETGSFSAAARLLGMSQSSLSHSIRRLEDELGMPVLTRTRSGVHLTRFGTAVMGDVERAISAIDGIYNFRDLVLRRSAERIRVGAVPVAARALAVPVVARLRDLFPDTEVQLREGGSRDVVSLLLEGEVDVGLVTSRTAVPPSAETLHAERLVTTEFRLCVPARHPFAARESVSAIEAARSDFVLYREGYLTHDFIRESFDIDVSRASIITDGIESAKLLVAAGAGVTILAELGLANDELLRSGKLVAVPIRGIPTALSVHLLTLHGAGASPIAQEFARLVRGIARGGEGVAQP